MPEGVRVRSASRHRLVQELQAREHRWLADLPAQDGGNGLGPTPLEILLGSFAARTAIGILELAREKEWAVDAVEVEISGAGEEPGDGAGELEREIVVRGELNDAEKRELESDVAERWPREGWLSEGALREKFSYP